MYNKTSEQFNDRIIKPGRTFRARILLGENVLEGFSSIKITNGSNAGEALTLGSTISQSIDVTMLTPEVSLEGQEFELEIGMFVDDETIEYMPIGLFTPEKVKVQSGKTSFTAYDRMLKLSGEYVSELAEDTDTISVLNEISEQTGVPISTNGLTKISIKNPKGYTYREALAYISQLYGTFANVNREGTIELHFWEDSGYVMTADQGITGFTHENVYTVEKIVCAVGQNSEGETVSISSGEGTNGISISNPFMTQEILDGILEAISGFSYTPVSCPLNCGDLRLDPWDLITVTAADGNSYKVPMMSLCFEYDGGVSCTIVSTVAAEFEANHGYKGPTETKLGRILASISVLEGQIVLKVEQSDIDEAVGQLAGETTEQYSEIKLTIDDITSTVKKNTTQIQDKADNASVEQVNSKVSELKQTIDGFKAEVSETYVGKADIEKIEIGARNLIKNSSNLLLGSFGHSALKPVKLEAPVIYLDVSKLEAPWIVLVEEESETSGKTSAVLGKAVLGKMVLGSK